MDFNEWLLECLYHAFIEARKGKRSTTDEYRFEINWYENLVQLRDDIAYRRYTPSRGIAFITHRPVTREIFAAPFRDRIVHHFLFDMSADWWDRRFIYDSYSCRLNKGTLFGIQRLEKHIREVSCNYTQPTYVMKMDIQGYFMSLPRARLFERVRWGLERQFETDAAIRDLLMYLWSEVIFDDPTEGVYRRGRLSDWDALPANKSLFCQPPGRGIVIGNLSSQLLSNIYLDQLDRYIFYDLCYKHYGRYVDDFYIVVRREDLSRLKDDVPKIDNYLRSLSLTLHPRKRYCQEVHHGVEFLGVVTYPFHSVPSRRYTRQFFEAASQVAAGIKDADTIASYLGHGVHINARKLEERVFDRFGWTYRY